LNGALTGGSDTPGASPSPSATALASAPPASAVASVSEGAAPSPTPVQTPAPTPRTYIVQQGDSLNEIATQFGTTAQAIRNANGITGDPINVGQVLIIP